MSSFKFYDVVGVLVPGALLLLLATWALPNWQAALLSSNSSNISVGDFGLFVVLAYVVGQLVQAFGDGMESFYWRIWGGLPTDWVRTGRHDLLGTEQLRSLQDRIPLLVRRKHGSDSRNSIQQMTRVEWTLTVRHMYAAIAAESCAGRVDTFNGIYGLNRGLTCVFALGAIFTTVDDVFLITPPIPWIMVGLFLIAGTITLSRMHRFAITYARELFMQYLRLPTPISERAERIDVDTSTHERGATEVAGDPDEPTHLPAS